jgi:DnaJ-class molecular chaperone
MSEVKRIDIKEFRRIGFLQEANRQFFHPLGLALEIVEEDCTWCHGEGKHRSHGGIGPMTVGQEAIPQTHICPHCGGDGVTERLGGVWDYRDDPEGILYGDDQMTEAKRLNVKAERDKHIGARLAEIKEVVQSVPRQD